MLRYFYRKHKSLSAVVFEPALFGNRPRWIGNSLKKTIVRSHREENNHK